MNGRNDFLVAVVTFLGTMIVVAVAWVIFRTAQQPSPPVQVLANVSDPSQPIRSKPGLKASHGADLAYARARIIELEHAIEARDGRSSKERQKTQVLAKQTAKERKQLLDDIALLQSIVTATTARSPKTESPVAKNTSEEPDPAEAPLESPLADRENVGGPPTIQAEEDLRDLEERLGRYIDRLNTSNDRLSAAAQSVVVQAGRSSVDGLITLLDSSEPVIQLWALQSLRQLGPTAGEAVPAVRALRDHPVPEVAESATATLRQILE
jgi:hypothetical protein